MQPALRPPAIHPTRSSCTPRKGSFLSPHTEAPPYACQAVGFLLEGHLFPGAGGCPHPGSVGEGPLAKGVENKETQGQGRTASTDWVGHSECQ